MYHENDGGDNPNSASSFVDLVARIWDRTILTNYIARDSWGAEKTAHGTIHHSREPFMPRDGTTEG